MTSDYGSMFGIQDQHLGQLATTPPRRAPAPGKADIGGRLRVAGILREAGVPAIGPERISGSTNEVWAAGDYVIRISFEKGSRRLRREAALAPTLSPDARYPHVVASGEAVYGEWLVLERRPGRVLSEQWLQLDTFGRRTAINELAEVLRSLHTTEPTTVEDESIQWAPDRAAGHHANDSAALSRMIDELEECRYVDSYMLEDARQRLSEVANAFEDEPQNFLLHGDLHLENVLAQGSHLTALLDLEWSHRGPREVDIDTLARFCISPQLHISGGYPVQAGDFREVLRWLAEGYPEIFEHPRLRDRLTWCALAYELPALLEMEPTAPARSLPNWHPVNRLSELLNFGSSAVMLGW